MVSSGLVTEIAEFSRTIRSYGPGELLCVCPADSTHPAGYVVPAAPGVFVGYIDFSGRLNETERRIEWALLCWSILGMSDILITE